MKSLHVIMLSTILAGCGSSTPSSPPAAAPPVAAAIVHGQAIIVVSSEQQSSLAKAFNLIMPSAMAATGSTTVTYANAANTTFTIDATNLVAGAFTGDTLSLGSVTVTALSDNNLSVCGTGGKSKCTQAVIRIYTTGSTAGFVNTTEATPYGAPVYAGSLNPSTAVGLGSTGSVQVQVHTILSTEHKLGLPAFPTPTYNVTSDFSNAGAGSYSMVFVVEYVLM